MPLQIETRQERTITIIRLVGSILNQDGAAVLNQSLDECLRQGQCNLLLEVAEVHGIDRAGVQALQSFQAKAKEVGGDLKLAGERFSFLAELALYDSGTIFPYYPDTEQALTAFADAHDSAPKGVKHFDILEFVKEQEKEQEEQE